jgi:hypothetical protein
VIQGKKGDSKKERKREKRRKYLPKLERKGVSPLSKKSGLKPSKETKIKVEGDLRKEL